MIFGIELEKTRRLAEKWRAQGKIKVEEPVNARALKQRAYRAGFRKDWAKK